MPARRFRPKIEVRSTDSLRPHAHNVRTHPKNQIKQIARSIEAFGFLVPILVDEHGTIIAGHGRHEAAKTLGLDEVPTICAAGLSEAEKRAYMLADNKLAANAGYDRKALASELRELAIELPQIELDLDITGFEAAEIDAIVSDSTDQPDPLDTIPPPRPPVSRRRDLWRLGPHMLLCGDARERDDLDRLMAGKKAKCAFIDPPWNVPVVGHVQGRGRTRHQDFAFASGEMSREEYQGFLKTGITNLVRVSQPGAVHFVCIDWRSVAELIAVGRELYEIMLNLCVWAKTSPGQGSFYRSQHELVAVFRVAGRPHQNNIQLGRFQRNRSNLWTYPGVNSFGRGRAAALAAHPTVKPVQLVADALRDCTTRGELIVDTFLGSGTTLIAAETVGRSCFGLEYEPGYIDVAIRRWQDLTRCDAVLEGDGRTFDEVAADRRASPRDGAER